jgi:hypothetical protein
MELLKEIVPHLKRVAYVIGVSEMAKIRSEIAADVARTLGFTSQVLVNANDCD